MNASTTTANRKLTRLEVGCILILMVVAFAVRIHGIGDQNFWVDEVHQYRVASQSVLDILKNYRPDSTYGTKDQAPLSFVVQHFFVRENDAEFWIRFPSAVFGAFGVLALFLVARRLATSPTALLAAGFLTLSPLDVWYGQEARWYAQWACVSTFSYLFLMNAVEKKAKRWWMAYGLAAVANLYTFLYCVFVTAAQGLSLLLRGFRDRESIRQIIWFACVQFAVLLAGLPVLNIVLGYAGKARSGTPRASSLLELPYTVYTYAAGFTFGPSLAELHAMRSLLKVIYGYPGVLLVALVFSPVVVLGIINVLRERSTRIWLLPWLVVPPILVFVNSAIMSAMTYQVRYSFAALPAFMLVIAIGTTSLKGWLKVVAGVSVVAVFVMSLGNLYGDPRYDKADVRGALTRVWSQERQQAQVVAVGQIEFVLPHYARDVDGSFVACGKRGLTDYTHVDPTDEIPGYPDEIDPSRTTWVIVGRDWSEDRKRCLEWLAPAFEVAETTTLTGVELIRLKPRSAGEAVVESD